MAVVRLIYGKECLTLDKNDLAALLDALWEHPLDNGEAESSAELRALQCALAQTLTKNGQASTPMPDTTEERDRMTAALASILSGQGDEAARRVFAEAALRCAAVRLDAPSALAFVDAIERSPQAAPPHLVEQIIADDSVATARAAARREDPGRRSFWSLITAGSWSARRWGGGGRAFVVGLSAIFEYDAGGRSVVAAHRHVGRAAIDCGCAGSAKPSASNRPTVPAARCDERDSRGRSQARRYVDPS
jgi:hypothetical protein